MPDDPTDTAWPDARRRAAEQGRQAQSTVRQPLGAALGCSLSASLRSLVDLPPFDTAAMDGWAVRGPGPWLRVGELRAGDVPSALLDGQCVQISTGAVAPPDTAIVRSEHGHVDGGRLHAAELTPVVG
ncbi:MAG TPA: molybdopterin molybdenumtransferase MoeA, partial [Actinomycetes bacterium]|nr:molybdopterin molybdenumtransferase MoeA [Actinomycetes bacterium]